MGKGYNCKICDKRSQQKSHHEAHLETEGHKDKRIITIYFNKNNYDLIGWRVVDQLQNEINFSIKIKNINSEINNKIFLIPSFN